MKKTLLLFLFFLVVSAFELMGQTVSNSDLYVGYYTSNAFIKITNNNGGYTLVYDGTDINSIFVGYGSNSTNNTCYFTLAWASIPGNWYVNYQGYGNTGVISYSIISVANSYLGYQPGSSNGVIQVTGNDSFLSGYTNFIGYQGSSNSFYINSYASNRFTYTIIGGTNTNDFSNVASNNTLSISDGDNEDGGMFILSSGNQLIIGPSANNNDANGDFHIYGYSNTVTINSNSGQYDNYMYIGGSNGLSESAFSNNTIFITNSTIWVNYGDSMYGNDIVASSGNQIIISNSTMSNDLASGFYLGLYGSSNSMTLASNSTFVLNGYVNGGGPSVVAMYVGGNAGTISNNIYIYDSSCLNLPGGGINLYVGNTNGASGNIYISNNSGSGSNTAIDGNTFIYNGTLSLHGTNATLYYNHSYENSGNFYICNGTLYCGENSNAFTQVETIALGNTNGTNATNTNTNASLYLSTNGETSMYFQYLEFYNNVNIYNINPNASQQIINVFTGLNDKSTVPTIGNISFISNVSLDNNIDPIINFGASSGFSNNFTSNFTFSVTGATVGQSSNTSTGSNYLYFWIPSNASITVAQSINETNPFYADTVTCTAGTFTASEETNGVQILTLNMISNSSLVLNKMMTANGHIQFLTTSQTTNTNLYIANGAELSTGESFFGANSGSTCNLINEGVLFSGSDTYLGYEGGGNTVLNITNDGVMSTYSMIVIGSNGNNVLNISDGSTCYTSNLIIESAYIGNSNTVNVNGGSLYVTNNSVTNTNPSLNYSLIVGYVGSHDYLNISNGGYVTNSLGVIGYSTNSSNNYAYVTGSNSTWINTNGFYVGFMGGKNNLIISNGGAVYVNGSQSFIGLASSSNTVTITGSNSIFSSYGPLNIGYYGSYNKVIISNGASVTNSGSYNSNYNALLGGYSNNNSVTIESNSLWTNNGNLFIGYYGSSNSVTNNGGTLNTLGIQISENSGKYNSLVINNSGTVNTDYFVMGYASNTNAFLNLTSTQASFNLTHSPYLYGTISNTGTITISYQTTNNGSIYNTGTITISNALYNYGYISNGGAITATTFYNYGTLVGNPVTTNTTYTSSSTLQSSGMIMGDHLVEMPHMIPLEQNDEISINEENAAYFVKEALQLASSLVYAQKPPPQSKPSHKTAFHHKKTGKKVDS